MSANGDAAHEFKLVVEDMARGVGGVRDALQSLTKKWAIFTPLTT